MKFPMYDSKDHYWWPELEDYEDLRRKVGTWAVNRALSATPAPSRSKKLDEEEYQKALAVVESIATTLSSSFRDSFAPKNVPKGEEGCDRCGRIASGIIEIELHHGDERILDHKLCWVCYDDLITWWGPEEEK